MLKFWGKNVFAVKNRFGLCNRKAQVFFIVTIIQQSLLSLLKIMKRIKPILIIYRHFSNCVDFILYIVHFNVMGTFITETYKSMER